MAHQIVWCDIPVKDLDRAIRFYTAVLGTPVKKEEFPNVAIGLFPFSDGEIGGCLYLTDKNRPSTDGPRVYLNVQGRLDDAISAVGPNGGRVVEPRHAIGTYGFRAIIDDSEGNRVALHSA
jgi:uncharacterized protein